MDAGATPVVSAEDCWLLKRHELLRLRGLIDSTGFRARVFVYLRPPLGWVTSMFQELLKSGHHAFVDPLLLQQPGSAALFDPLGFDYLSRLSVLEDVFGSGSIRVRAFRSELLAGGCVVQDFCQEVGIEMPARRIRRVNERLSLAATRLLYAYNRFAREGDSRSFGDFLLLMRRLEECPGGPLRLHPSLLAPVRPLLEAQFQEIRRRFGIDLTEDWTKVDGDMVASENDLMRFSAPSITWLYRETTGTPLRNGCPDALPRDVGVRVSRLEPRLWHRAEDRIRGGLRALRRMREQA
jgi:hypothetical protein